MMYPNETVLGAVFDIYFMGLTIASVIFIFKRLSSCRLPASRFYPFFFLILLVKWLSFQIFHFNFPDVIYLLILAFWALPDLTKSEKIFYALLPPIFVDIVSRALSYYVYPFIFHCDVGEIPHHPGLIITYIIVVPTFLLFQKLFNLNADLQSYSGREDKQYDKMLLRIDIIMILYYPFIYFKGFNLLTSEEISRMKTFMPAYIWSGIVFLIFILVRFFAYSKELQDRRILQEQEEHLHNLEAYNQQIEAAYKNIRSFKHDYENILISMQSSIDSGDFNLIERTYQDVLKKAGQDLIDERFDKENNLKDKAD
ncbi:histidine kinase [Streptococcus dentiloxodontae]